MAKRNLTVAALAVALLAAGISTTTAWSSARVNHLTFSGAVALPGVILPAGTYVFELVVPGSTGDVVKVSSKKDGRHYFMAFTQRIERPAARRSASPATFGEASAGMPPPITAWYPVGSSRGHRFIYPETR
jgi:hypothetical protein